MTFELIQVGKFALFVDDDDPYNKGVKVSWYIVFPFGLKLALAIASDSRKSRSPPIGFDVSSGSQSEFTHEHDRAIHSRTCA